MIEMLQGKRILFITTKNLDYIRNVQEINLIKLHAKQYTIIGSHHSSYFIRLFHVYTALFFTKMSSYDTVFVGFAPQLVLPFFHWKFKNKLIIEDFFISLYDTLFCDRKKCKSDGAIAAILHKLDQKALKLSKHIICDTNAHGDYFSNEFGISRSAFQTLYLEADATIYHPITSVRPKYLQDKYVVLYFGSILPLQGIDVILEAINLLKNEDNLFFICIGPIPEKVQKVHSSRIEYIPWLPQEELAKYISYSDLCLAGHFNASIQKAARTIPGKAYIYRAMKKPMILGDNPANHELFCPDKDTTFVEMGNASALAEAILHHMVNH